VLLALGCAGVVAGLALTDLTSAPHPAVTAAHERTFLPALLALGAAGAGRFFRGEKRRRTVALLVVAGALLSLRARLSILEQPTDAREAAFVRGLRPKLDRGARVACLERSGSQIARLPLYAGRTAARSPLSDADAGFDLSTLPEPAYYFRSSLCSTAAGAPTCAALERDTKLELVAERTLSARPSMRWHAYDSEVVRVALYRIRR
jgi:hypothetical protein